MLRTDGTKDRWSTPGLINGTVTLTDGLPEPGQYEARLFFNNTHTAEATSEIFTVSIFASQASLSTDKSVYDTGEAIKVTFTNAAGNSGDWIGLYRPGTSSLNDCLGWLRTDGTKDRWSTAGLINGWFKTG